MDKIERESLRGRTRIYAVITCENGHTEKRLYDNIIHGHGCQTCAKKQHRTICIAHNQKYSPEDVARILEEKGYEWLNATSYINASSIIEYRCDNCGRVVHANISNIISGRECRCRSQYKKKTTNEFSEIVSSTDDGYKLLSEYVTCKDKVLMRHNACGHIFSMTPDSFIGGSRCPHCMTSHGEVEIKRALDKAGIKYFQQYKFNDCRNKRPLPFDFYIPDANTCIEYNGQQHYTPVDYYGGASGFEYRKANDEIKRRYCLDNGISLIIIPYWEFKNIGGVIDGLITKTR